MIASETNVTLACLRSENVHILGTNVCVFYLEEVFNFRVVVSFLLNQRCSVQLTRTEPANRI